MSDEMFKAVTLFYDDVKKVLSDKFINDYTKWKYEKYERLCIFLIDNFGI